MEKHINVVAALYIGLGILSIVSALFFGLFFGIFTGFIPDSPPRGILYFIIMILIGASVILSIPGIIAGIGLINRKEWARVLTIILSAIRIINIPIGTCIGAYSLWVLINDETVMAFRPERVRTLG